MSVYKAINAVQRDLARTGITKDRMNQQQGYKFRGIDDVFNTLSPLLAEHGLCILPRILERTVVERVSERGKALFYVTVCAEFDFVCVEDGSTHIVRTYGEAMDSADKATNKAMSAAYKYAALQAFAIPTEADNDADAHTYEVAAATDAVLAAARQAAGLGLDAFRSWWRLQPQAIRDSLRNDLDDLKAIATEAGTYADAPAGEATP